MRAMPAVQLLSVWVTIESFGGGNRRIVKELPNSSSSSSKVGSTQSQKDGRFLKYWYVGSLARNKRCTITSNLLQNTKYGV